MLAGYYVSPADRLRVLRLLGGLGKTYLREPGKLKTLLCPLIAHSKADQERFYELFDRYWEEVSQPWELSLPPELPTRTHRLPGWLRWLLPALTIGGMAWGAWKLLVEKNPPAPPDPVISHAPEVRLGDTLYVQNHTENIDGEALRWEIFIPGDSTPEFVDTQSFNLEYIVVSAGENPNREIRLSCPNRLDPETGQPASITSNFLILCNFPPAIEVIEAPREVQPGDSVLFTARLADTAGVNLTWDFGDGVTASGNLVKHPYAGMGAFEVRLTATRTGVEGSCRATATHPISVGRDKAFLAAKPLWPDQVTPLVNFSWGTWILLGLLGLVMIVLWLKWIGRKPPPLPEESEDLSAAAEQFKAVDKAPYFIPFRPQESNVRVERELYRLADVLRMRQEGIRKNFDVPASVSRTITGGGFPQLVSRADSMPTEYLFLVDEQAFGSHQAQLYRFLVDFLRQREVLGEVFYFKHEPLRCWNDQHPDGLQPEQVRRLFTHHRLIVLGDAHALLDPLATGRPQVRPDASGFFRQWKHRLLLTPIPVVSWTYREGALHGLFAVFPSDTEGLAEAIQFLERGMEEEDLPPYAAWCERLLEGRAEPDINYRRWRTAAEHRDYLKEHPALYHWLCALAVYPKPDWNITLAIGHAISTARSADLQIGVPPPRNADLPIGVTNTVIVNYDNLLLLSRIPWLQTGDLSPRLRRELLSDLDPETERIAREAVQTELQAVESLVQGSHVNQEHQINLALQNFALTPQSPETQAAIRRLQALNLLTPRHIAELDQTVERHLTQGSLGEMSKYYPLEKAPTSTPGIRQFLAENKPKPKPPKRPFFTKNFWLASTATGLYLLIFLFAWKYGGTRQLAAWVGVDATSTTNCAPEFMLAGFLKKECVADSAVLYNNAGVEKYNNALAGFQSVDTQDNPKNQQKPSPNLREERLLNFYNRLVDAMADFQRALELKPEYELAKANLGKAHFIGGKAFYDDFLEKQGADRLPWALQSFHRAAAFDSVKIEALHGIGLAHFYQEQLSPPEQPMIDSLPSRTNSLIIDKKPAEKKQGRASSPTPVEVPPVPPDSSLIIYNALLALDSTYFDTLATYPHLQSLLFKKQRQGRQLVTLQVRDSTSGIPMNQVLVTADNFQRQTDKTGAVQLEMMLGERRVFNFTKKGYQSLSQEIRPGAGELVFQINMQPAAKTPTALTSTTSVIYFDADKTVLRQDARQALETVAALLMKNPNWTLTLTGHTDSQGTAAYSKQTSLRLAQAAADFLAGKGITRERLTVKGVGNTQPASSQNRQANNRVTLEIARTGSSPQQNPPDTAATPIQTTPLPATGLPAGFPLPEMVAIRGGTFRRGCDEKRDYPCQQDELPSHDVMLDDFSIGKYEVTNEQYAAFLNAYGSTEVKDGLYKGQLIIYEHERGIEFPNPKGGSTAYRPQRGYEKYPVVNVTWYGANEYCAWLSQQTGRPFRLPTEAEWEYAARGGSRSGNFRHAGSNNPGEVAWYNANSGGQTRPTGQKKANETGLFDMSGNAWEWCSDWYDGNYYQQFVKGEARNPKGAASGAVRVLRGGSWYDDDNSNRVADRLGTPPGDRSNNYGFRVAQGL